MNKAVITLTLILAASIGARAQTPPPASPAQQDATRPPATPRPPQTAPPSVSPSTNDATRPTAPTAPPGVQRDAQQTPQGVDAVPPTEKPASQTAQPESSPAATSVEQGSGATVAQQDTAKPALSSLLEARTIPPLPSLVRLGVSSDQTITLSLNDVVRRALENNNDIEIARGDVRRAETTLLFLEGIYDPVFSFVPGVSHRVTPVASALGGSDRSGTVTTNDFNFDVSLTKPFRTGGGQYQFFFNNTRESTSSTFSQLNPFYSSNSGVTFTQPLLRNRSIDLNRRLIRVQRKTLQQSDADFRRLTANVIANAQRAYWELVFALRDQQNRIANLQLTRELFRQTETRIEAGSVAPFERAEVQTELANREAELLAAVRNVTSAEIILKTLILRNPLAQEWSAALVPTDVPSFDVTPVNLADALREARANRPELTRLNLQQEISDIDLQYFRNQTRPRIDVEATVSTTGLAGSPVIPTGALSSGAISSTGASGQVPLISGDANASASAFLLSQINQLRAASNLPPADVPLVTTEAVSLPPNLVGGYGRTLRNLVGLGTRNIVVSVRIELPLHNKRAKAELAGALVQRTQLEALRARQEQLVEAEVRLAAQAVETARQSVLVARGARRNAELQLEGERQLYEVGRSTTFLLFQRENALTNARNLELRVETDYNKALADLQQATSTVLSSNNVVIESFVER